MLAELAHTASAPDMEQIGSAFTVKVAAVEVVVLQVLLNCARYCLPLSLPLALKLYVLLFAPAIFVKAAPPSVLTCH